MTKEKKINFEYWTSSKLKTVHQGTSLKKWKDNYRMGENILNFISDNRLLSRR